jgi:PPOX class probable F420-dependent enzyme
LQRLLREPVHCQVATLMPDGSPQITQVWVDTDGTHVLVNTAEGRQKVRNVRRDPRVALNVVDPSNAWRLAGIRGRVVEVTAEGGDDLIDQLAKKYLDADRYPFRQPGEVRLTLKIAPEKVNEMGLE